MKCWLTAVVVCLAAGCSQTPQRSATATAYQPPSAGRRTNPLVTVGHLASIEVAGLTGDQRAMRAHLEAMHKNMMRDMRLADPSRPINYEAARAAVRPLLGVQSGVWIDRSNTLVMVGGGQYRSIGTIDRICGSLEQLGDVVNVEELTATDPQVADTLSRNCLLKVGVGADDVSAEVERCAGSGDQRDLSGAVRQPMT